MVNFMCQTKSNYFSAHRVYVFLSFDKNTDAPSLHVLDVLVWILFGDSWSYVFFVRGFGYAFFIFMRKFYEEVKKQMKTKKFLAVALAVIMLLCSAPVGGFIDTDWSDFALKAIAESYNGECGDNLTWSLNTEKGELLISGTGEMYDYGTYYDDAPAPWSSFSRYVRSVIINNGVTSIGSWAFYRYGSLESVKIPASVTNIDTYAFNGCRSITSFSIDKENQYYSSDSYGAMYNKDKTELIRCPAGNTGTSFTVPYSVTKIGSQAFDYCYNLTDIYYSGKPLEWVKIFGRYGNPCNAVVHCSGIPDGSIIDSGNGDYDEIHYEDGIEWYINDYGEVTISGTGKMYCCFEDDSYYVPWNRYSDYVTYFSVDEANEYYSSDSYGVLYNKDKTKIISYPCCNNSTSFTIPSSVSLIEKSAFYGCEKLTDIYYSGTAFEWAILNVYIGSDIKVHCSSLSQTRIIDSGNCGEGYFESYEEYRNYVWGDSQKWNIDNYGKLTISGTGCIQTYDSDGDYFPWGKYKNHIKSIIIEEGITGIGEYAFSGCTSLESIEIPNSVTSIGQYTFWNCSSLESIYITDLAAWYNIEVNYASGLDINLCNLYINNVLTDEITVPEAVTEIKSGKLNFKNITSVTIPENVISIASNAFFNCYNLSDITILSPDCDISFDAGTFYQSAVIHGFHNSTAYKYAITNGRKFVPLDNHTLETEFELPATCSAYGFKTIACKYCDYKTNEIIEPFGHTDTDEDNKCDYCKISLATSVCDHDNEIDYTAPTCTEDGKIVIKCKTCTKTSEKVIEKLGHNYVDFVIEPTCTSDGYTKHYCVNCGDEKHDTPVKAPGHSMRTETIKPTCTENGCDVVICENCGYNYEANEVKAVGHSYKVVSEERYCFTEGEIVYKCDACGESYDEVAPLIPHTDKDNDGICDICRVNISGDETEKCTHMCHQSGFMGFIWKLINFFNKLFRINQYCECGAKHW